jgi:chemotaxis protein MotA
MEWLAGIPEIAVLLLGVAAAIAGSLWFASRFEPGPFFRWLLPPPEHAPSVDIDRLTSLAAIAKAEGLLSLEAHIAGSGDEILEAGIQLLIDGVPRPRVRRELESVLDRRISIATRAGGGRWTRVAHLLVLAAAVAGLVAAWRVGTTAPGFGPGVMAFFVSLASLLGLAFVGPLCDRSFAVAGSGIALSGLLTLEAVVMIGDRADAGAVRAALTALLPPSAQPDEARLAA